ncbi:MAG: hypothetical protein ACE5JE_04820 [Thermoplasmata archaeon]
MGDGDARQRFFRQPTDARARDMPTSLDLTRLVRMSQELLVMGWHGAHPRRLGILALNLLMAREAASRLARRATAPTARDRARRALAFIGRLEEQVMRLYATHRARPRGLTGLTPGYGRRRG